MKGSTATKLILLWLYLSVWMKLHSESKHIKALKDHPKFYLEDFNWYDTHDRTTVEPQWLSKWIKKRGNSETLVRTTVCQRRQAPRGPPRLACLIDSPDARAYGETLSANMRSGQHGPWKRTVILQVKRRGRTNGAERAGLNFGASQMQHNKAPQTPRPPPNDVAARIRSGSRVR